MALGWAADAGLHRRGGSAMMPTMARTILWFAYFWLFQLVSTLFLLAYFLLGVLGARSRQARLLGWITRAWARQMIGLAGGRIEVSGLENLPAAGGVLFVANHQGAFDIPLLIGFLPGIKGFVSKKENFRLPIVSTWMRLLGCIVIDRGDLRQSARAIARGIDALRAGRSLVIFPEGTRSQSGRMNAFKEGSFKLATRSGAAIVPLTIDGSFRLLEGHHGRVTPGIVHLTVHPPLSPGERGDGAVGLAERVQRIIASALADGGVAGGT